MRLLVIVTAVLLLVSTTTALAGPGHDHHHGHDHGDHHHVHAKEKAKLNEKEVIAAASKGLTAMISQKIKIEGSVLDTAWESVPATAKSIAKKGKGYFVVRINNKSTGKDLYVLLSDRGEVYDANFKGTFPDLKE